jgi:hypothetical protein
VVLLSAATALAQSPAASALPLGRLFLTDQQRQELDRRRQLNIAEVVVVNEGAFTVNGHVSRSSGKTTTWINGAPRNDGHRSGDPAAVPLSPAEGEAPVTLKVGQTLDKARGTVTDRVPAGSVKVDRSARGGR